MNPWQHPLILRIGRITSVTVAVAAMMAFVILEHRRLNPGRAVPSAEPREDDATSLTVGPESGNDDAGADTDTQSGATPAWRYSGASMRAAAPDVRVEVAIEPLTVPPLPALPLSQLVPPPASDETLLIYTTESEVYMSSSKFAAPPPETKKPKGPPQKR